jgi:hypothetical protein
LYHYIIIRKDIPIGHQFAQITHAAGESSPGNLPSNTHAVVLYALDEQELLRLGENLQKEGFNFCLIREPDAPYNGAATAIGIKPQMRTKALRKITSNLKLAGKEL